jgi:hypothetical protein
MAFNFDLSQHEIVIAMAVVILMSLVAVVASTRQRT